MATLTGTAASAGAQPKLHDTGVIAATFAYTLSAALGSNDVILMGKIPNKAKILAIQRNFALAGDNDIVLNVGIDADVSGFGSATGKAGVAFLTKGLDFDVSLTDAADPQYSIIKLKAVTVTSATATGTVALTVFYTMDNPR